MLLKYNHNGDNRVTEISDATIDSNYYSIYFKPLDNTLLTIKLQSSDLTALNNILTDLFNTGKADISYLGSVELFNCIKEL